jgi:hypothetical protein
VKKNRRGLFTKAVGQSVVKPVMTSSSSKLIKRSLYDFENSRFKNDIYISKGSICKLVIRIQIWYSNRLVRFSKSHWPGSPMFEWRPELG